MGVVYRCLDAIGGIEVALKCLPPELSRNEAEMEGIRENYGLVARLHHSAISVCPAGGEYRVSVRDGGDDEFNRVVVTCEGSDESGNHVLPRP